MSDQKTLFMLIGPKGSGKTHIGTLIHQHTDIVFLRVEPIWLGLQPDEDGWKKVEAAIDTLFLQHGKVMIESLGIGEGFSRFRASLAGKYSIKMIRVYADLETCFTQVKTRNNDAASAGESLGQHHRRGVLLPVQSRRFADLPFGLRQISAAGQHGVQCGDGVDGVELGVTPF